MLQVVQAFDRIPFSEVAVDEAEVVFADRGAAAVRVRTGVLSRRATTMAATRASTDATPAEATSACSRELRRLSAD